MATPEEIEKAKEELIKINQELLKYSEENFPLPKEESDHWPVLYLFRHGQSLDNENFVFSGWRDSPLSKTGLAQASVLAKKLQDKKIDVGIHSGLNRSKKTLAIVINDNRISPVRVETDQRIIERNYGDLQGTSKTEMFLNDPGFYNQCHRAYDLPPKNGEGFKMVEERVFPFCAELKARMIKEKINVALSSHGNSMRVIRRFFEKLTIDEMCSLENPLGQDYCSYVIQ